jgi:hypothetical protein
LGNYRQIRFLRFSSDDLNCQIWLFGSLEEPNIIWVTHITKFGHSVLLLSFGSSGKFTKEEPACNCLPFDDRRFTMMQTTAAFTT